MDLQVVVVVGILMFAYGIGGGGWGWVIAGPALLFGGYLFEKYILGGPKD